MRTISATEIKKLAEIIEFCGWYVEAHPERDSRAEFIKSAIRGDLDICHPNRRSWTQSNSFVQCILCEWDKQPSITFEKYKSEGADSAYPLLKEMNFTWDDDAGGREGRSAQE